MISDAENNFIADLLPPKQDGSARGIWLDITDSDEEGHFVDYDGSSLSWTNWKDSEPNNKNGNEGWFIDLK